MGQPSWQHAQGKAIEQNSNELVESIVEGKHLNNNVNGEIKSSMAFHTIMCQVSINSILNIFPLKMALHRWTGSATFSSAATA